MGMTYFTALSAFLWICVFILIITLFKYYTLFRKHFSIGILFFAAAVCVIRITIPLEFPFTHVIETSGLYSGLFRRLSAELFSIGIGSSKISITFISMLLTLSIVGSVFVAAVETYKSRRLYEFFRILPSSEDERILTALKNASDKVGVSKKMKVVVHRNIESPAIIGRYRPIIAMPDLNFSDLELKGILVHELIHYKCNHIALKLVVYVIRVLFWWNPLVYMLGNDIDDILEFHADSKINKLLDKDEQLAYLNGIIKVLASNSDKESNQLPTSAIGLAENNSSSIMEQRFKMLLDDTYKKKNTVQNALAVIVICSLFIFSYSFVIQPHFEPNYYDYNDDFLYIPPGSYIIEDDKTYTIYDSNDNAIVTANKPIDKSIGQIEIRNKGGMDNEAQ